MTEDGARAAEIARELDLLNHDRREAETRILFAADRACGEQAAAAALVVAGEGWHPGVVGIVASRLVERWGRPCVVIGLDGEAGRGSGRSIPAYDLHAGLAASADHLRRFGGHRVAAGLEIDASELSAFRAALAGHAGEALSPADLIPVERIDAVVPGGALGLALAEELEALRPFGAGNPEPTLLVPAARLKGVAGMGAERQHARFTLVTGNGLASGVAFGSPPRALASGDEPHDLALRLERNRWNGAVEPRVVLRAVCPTRRGTLRVLADERPFAQRLDRAFRAEPPETGGLPVRARRDRRGEGVAGVAGDLLTSGETVLIAVADVPRRRESLERLVAGVAPGELAVARWDDLIAEPALAEPFAHLVGLDPPPGVDPAALPGPAEGAAHLAWGAPEVEFALAVWRAELDLRPALVEAYRSLRDAGGVVDGAELERALVGRDRHPRSVACCGRILRVLCELELVSYSGGGCSVGEAVPTELERSPTYTGCLGRLAELERAFGAAERTQPVSALPA
jgi:single-stranded-DNA-specific exonuclease